MTDNQSEFDRQRLDESRQYWDGLAASFDAEADHGLRDAPVLEAWTGLLKAALPAEPAEVLDIGCGTGSLSVVLAGLGHAVTGVDLSPAMIELAREKAAARGVQVTFAVMDAAFPWFAGRQFDALVCRHLLWALPEPEKVIQRWVELLEPAGRLFLVEGFWGTGAGLRATQVAGMLAPFFSSISIQDLSDNPLYWGGAVNDERYAILAMIKGV